MPEIIEVIGQETKTPEGRQDPLCQRPPHWLESQAGSLIKEDRDTLQRSSKACN